MRTCEENSVAQEASYRVGCFKRLVRLRSSQKAMESCTAQCKMLLFCANTVVRESAKFELARLKKEEEEENRFWRSTFATVIHDTGSLLGLENTRRRIVSWLICCPFFEIWRDLGRFFCISF